MNDFIKKRMLLAFSFAFSVVVAGQAQALTISIYSASQQTEIDNWIASVGGNAIVIEDFETVQTGWYDHLTTAVGNFTLTDNTLAGTGSTSYATQVGGEGTFFELRDYNADGRVNTTEGGTNYLDTADITELSLDLNAGFNNLFFYLSDPSDIRAMTTTSAATAGTDTASEDLNYKLPNGSLWFVGIDAGDEYLANITWSATRNGEGYTNDGFGLDDFSTVNKANVPEPSTALLLATGIIPLIGSRLRRKRKGTASVA